MNIADLATDSMPVESGGRWTHNDLRKEIIYNYVEDWPNYPEQQIRNSGPEANCTGEPGEAGANFLPGR